MGNFIVTDVNFTHLKLDIPTKANQLNYTTHVSVQSSTNFSKK